MLAREKLPAESRNAFDEARKDTQVLSLSLSFSSRVLVFHAFFPRDAFLASRKLTREYFIFKGSAPEDQRLAAGGRKKLAVTRREGKGLVGKKRLERTSGLPLYSRQPPSLSLSLYIYIYIYLCLVSHFVIMNFVDDVINVD